LYWFLSPAFHVFWDIWFLSTVFFQQTTLGVSEWLLS
jgi:hypothetical protein